MSDEKVDLVDATITHLLGYLTPEQWADAIKNNIAVIDVELFKKLIKIQEEEYNFELWDDVEALYKE